MRQTCGRNSPIDLGLPAKVGRSRMTRGVDRKRDIHFRDVHLDIQCGEPGDIGIDAVEIGLQIGQMCICMPMPSMGTPRCLKSFTMA